jgi:hypothetical protein
LIRDAGLKLGNGGSRNPPTTIALATSHKHAMPAMCSGDDPEAALLDVCDRLADHNQLGPDRRL